MAKIRLLSPSEYKAFQDPPIFNDDEKMNYFGLTGATRRRMLKTRTSYRKVGFILQLGYFRYTGRFFNSSRFHEQDILFVSKMLNIDPQSIELSKYKEHSHAQDQKKIMALLGFKFFEGCEEAKSLLSQEVARLVKQHVRPKMIIYYLSEFFCKKKIEVPSYKKIEEEIIKASSDFEESLISVLKNNLTKDECAALDSLLPKSKNANKPEARYANAPIVPLRNINLSARTGKIKESTREFSIIKDLFEKTSKSMQSLSMPKAMLKYYAVWTQKAKVTQLMQLNNPHEKYLHLVSFVAHQYYCRQDIFVDIWLQLTQSTVTRIEKAHEKEDKNAKKERERATKALSTSYKDKTQLLMAINVVLNNGDLSAEEKVDEIKSIIGNGTAVDPAITAIIDKLNEEISLSMKNAYFYIALEGESIRLQKKLSPILKNIEFNALNSSKPLLEAILHFKDSDGQISNNPPCSFLEEVDLTHIRDEKGKIKQSLYKALLFVKVSEAIKSGEINLLHSYRYLSIDEYLINKKAWEDDRQNYINRAELSAYSNLNEVITPLNNKLDALYGKVNESINNGDNIHASINKDGDIVVKTPKVEKIETIKIAALLKQKNYVSILDVLNIVDGATKFNDCLQHYSVTQKTKRPGAVVFYAGLIGKGCNIGLGKLAGVSKGINANTLENTVNWYFSHDNLMSANNKIIKFINKLDLPNHIKRTLGKLHTSSDGQKRNVDTDSILANFSFKYHGSGRGVSIYDFIDERHLLFHSLVMSSSEREAAYVIDGLMCNDEVKSDIHSTDTHGYTDLVFAITHLLGISFAPRLAKLKKRALYCVSPAGRKSYKKKGYSVLPDEAINLELIEENWDDILRLVATIKLKEATASQILKRLSSYAKDNPLYKGLKEFGKLIKTIFLLTYIDDLDLRQAIQKQLNKIELSNKFSSAVFFDNNQEFKQGTREEQEIAMACKILLQNAILLWNYLYLSHLLMTAENDSKREELLKIIKNGSIMTWQHLNLLGEYDFRNRPASNDAFFNIKKTLMWKMAQ